MGLNIPWHYRTVSLNGLKVFGSSLHDKDPFFIVSATKRKFEYKIFKYYDDSFPAVGSNMHFLKLFETQIYSQCLKKSI